MFHCNGWGHAWTMTLMAGTIICCRAVSASEIFNAVADHKVSHFGGAPIVLSMLINAPEEEREDFGELQTAGDSSTGMDNTALRYIRKVRERKGLMIDSSRTVVAAEKQRTLKR